MVREELTDSLRSDIYALLEEVAKETVEAAGEDPSHYTFEISEKPAEEFTKLTWTMTKTH